MRKHDKKLPLLEGVVISSGITKKDKHQQWCEGEFATNSRQQWLLQASAVPCCQQQTSLTKRSEGHK